MRPSLDCLVSLLSQDLPVQTRFLVAVLLQKGKDQLVAVLLRKYFRRDFTPRQCSGYTAQLSQKPRTAQLPVVLLGPVYLRLNIVPVLFQRLMRQSVEVRND